MKKMYTVYAKCNEIHLGTVVELTSGKVLFMLK